MEAMGAVTEVVKIEECDLNFINDVEEAGGRNVYACFQCGTCSGGCPVSFVMDYTPRRIMRMVQLGMREKVLSSATIWLCSSCNTCITRCPREVELPAVMAALKSIAIKEGIDAKIKEGPIFYKTMIENIKKYGRVHETGLFMSFARKTGGLMKVLKELPLGITLLRKGKLKLSPEKIESTDQLKTMFKSIEQLDGGVSQ